MIHGTYDWTTVAITVLPAGWRNVLHSDDGDIFTQPCPAVLLQELRQSQESDCDAQGRPIVASFKRTIHETPFETRSIAGGLDGAIGPDGGQILPVDELPKRFGAYLGTISPDQEIPNEFHQVAKAAGELSRRNETRAAIDRFGQI